MIKVFIIDDSMFIRNVLKKTLKEQKGIVIIGEAANPVDALQEFKLCGMPDVFILDIEMPKMDGLSFLKKLKEQRPIPTIIFSSIVADGCTKTMEALSNGACEVLKKPENINNIDQDEFALEFIMKIKAAAKSKSFEPISVETRKKVLKKENIVNKIIAIGSSTGGVQTLESILVNLEAGHQPIVITQHMPAGFTNSFGKRLNKLCKNSMVKEVENNETLECACVYIAPGDLHLELERTNTNQYKAILKDYPKVSNHKPSVDVLFKSVAKEVKQNAVAFILTGMGKDGAKGIKSIKDLGGKTYAQDEKSSIVYGMPKVAFETGGVDKQVSIEEIIEIINEVK